MDLRFLPQIEIPRPGGIPHGKFTNWTRAGRLALRGRHFIGPRSIEPRRENVGMTLSRQNALLAFCLLAGVAVSVSLGKDHQPPLIPNRWSKNPNFPALVSIRRPLSAPVQNVSFHGIQIGMTRAEVDARLGPPQRVDASPNRRVYFVPGQLNLTVEFFNNRVRFLQGTQIDSDRGEAIFVWVEQGRELF